MCYKAKTILGAVPLLLVVLGCANPADDKPAATVGEPVSPTKQVAATEDTVLYSLTDESKVNWIGSKVTGRHEGGFASFTGTITGTAGEPTTGQINLTIDATSIWSDNPRLTEHLKGADFFDVEKFPSSTFASTKIEAKGADYLVTGNLELHGVTKSITFPAQIAVAGEGASATAEFSINRSDFGITYEGKADDLIRDEVVIAFDIRAST
jgi:polyisoprenoid-binding protein YceI